MYLDSYNFFPALPKTTKICRHLDSSYIDLDVQPVYVRVTIKGKALQLTLPCEIRSEKCSAKRNLTTGSLTITMPRLNPLPVRKPKVVDKESIEPSIASYRPGTQTRREFLEIGPPKSDMDFSRIVENWKKEKPVKKCEFLDNPEVPPLE